MATSKMTGIRIPPDLLQRLEERRQVMLASMPDGLDLNLSDVIRVLLTRALEMPETPRPAPTKPKRPK